MNAPWKAETTKQINTRDKQEAIEAVEQEIGAYLTICHRLSTRAAAKLNAYDTDLNDTVTIDNTLHCLEGGLDEMGKLEE